MEELPLGIHTLAEGVPVSDTIKCALYGPNASLGPSTDAYILGGEVVGGGYTAGGVELTTGLMVVGSQGSPRNGGPQFGNAYIQPVDDTIITVANVAVRGCLLYNVSQNNRTIFTLDFGESLSPSVGIILTWGIASVVAETDALIPIQGRNF